MTINSLQFLFFFSVVIVLYWSMQKNYKLQNILLLGASYYFYGVANWKMCALLLVATTIFYFLGIAIEKNVEKNEKKASLLTTTGVVLGVGVLLYFKYLNFFIESLASLFNAIGLHCNAHTFTIILPIGISFFTFKLISYVLEVSRQRMDATRDFISFATYVAFFPTILSGPIDRPSFMSQLDKSRKINADNLSEGLKRVLWGLFLKMCIADRLSPWTDAVLNNYAHHNATSIIAASILYLIQMYADFAGYSDMAIGVSRMMGIRVIENFKRPFFAQNIAEYWRNWHISLTQWCTDYIFKPLTVTFRRWDKMGLYLATLINFVIIGAWHGANWTFVLFGVYHGLLLVAVLALEKPRKKFEKKHGLKKNEYYKWSRRVLTFALCAIGAVLWRAESVGDFLGTMAQLCSGFGPLFTKGYFAILSFTIPSIAIMFFDEWLKEYNKKLRFFHNPNVVVRLVSIVLMAAWIIYMGELEGDTFIYFQF